jgi:HEAT repeat protein
MAQKETHGMRRARNEDGKQLRSLAIVGALLCLAGCTTGGPRIPAHEQSDLARRARELLLRAGQSEVDVVSCNAIEALVRVAPEDGRPVFRAALHAPAPMVRFAGLLALGTVRDRGALDSINAAATDADPHVRLAAAFAAYRCGLTENGQVLVQALHDSLDENVRADAAMLIGQIGERSAVKRLRVARTDRSNKVRVQVYAAMAILGDQDAVEELINFAQEDEVSRVLALQTLADLGEQRAKTALAYRFAKDDYVENKLIAARGLGKLGVKDGYKLALQETAHAATDETERMRIRSLAALALGAIGDPQALPALKRLAEAQDDPRVQVAACYAICQLTALPSAR